MHAYVRRTDFTNKPCFEIAKELRRCCSPIGHNNTKHFFPNQEPPFAWPFGHGVASFDTQGFFRSCLETFVAPFLPTLATDCPLVSKVDWCFVSNTMSIPTSADKQNQWPNRILTRAAVKLRSHGNPAVPTSRVDADVNGFKRSDKLMINYGMTICVSVEYLKKITNKRNNRPFFKIGN